MAQPEAQLDAPQAAAGRSSLGGAVLLTVLSLVVAGGGAGAILVTLDATPHAVSGRAVGAMRQSMAMAARTLDRLDRDRAGRVAAHPTKQRSATARPLGADRSETAASERRRLDASAGLLNLPPPGARRV